MHLNDTMQNVGWYVQPCPVSRGANLVNIPKGFISGKWKMTYKAVWFGWHVVYELCMCVVILFWICSTSNPTTSITSRMHISSAAFYILNCRELDVFSLYEWVSESFTQQIHLTTLVHTVLQLCLGLFLLTEPQGSFFICGGKWCPFTLQQFK